jgi:hypothetical protein
MPNSASNPQNAVTGATTLPASQAPNTVSAPGVGLGHAANGVPIENPGSGLARATGRFRSPADHWRRQCDNHQTRHNLVHEQQRHRCYDGAGHDDIRQLDDNAKLTVLISLHSQSPAFVRWAFC